MSSFYLPWTGLGDLRTVDLVSVERTGRLLGDFGWELPSAWTGGPVLTVLDL